LKENILNDKINHHATCIGLLFGFMSSRFAGAFPGISRFWLLRERSILLCIYKEIPAFCSTECSLEDTDVPF
jgi:hypothetical protein